MAERSLPDTRAFRGLRLFVERRDEIVFYPTTGEYGVPSATEEGVIYHVDLEAEAGEICECACHRFVGGSCKHIYVALLKRASRNAGAALPVSRRRCSRRAVDA